MLCEICEIDREIKRLTKKIGNMAAMSSAVKKIFECILLGVLFLFRFRGNGKNDPIVRSDVSCDLFRFSHFSAKNMWKACRNALRFLSMNVYTHICICQCRLKTFGGP